MWRSAKALVAGEFTLPPRRLQQALLRFPPQERAFYSNILERARAMRSQWREVDEAGPSSPQTSSQQVRF